MARILVTGSSDGLGQIIARNLISQGHSVTLHARNSQRAAQAEAGAPGAEGVLIADLSSMKETKQLAADANKTGRFDVVVHNAGLGFQQGDEKTEDGIAAVFAVNSLAPYILTSLMDKPKRLVYMSSGLHEGGDDSLKDITWASGRSWQGFQAYSDSKLHNVLLAFAVARHWPDVVSNACTPGWVRTKMGGSGAPGDAETGSKTATYLALSDNAGTGKYWADVKVKEPHKGAKDTRKQDEYLRICEEISKVPFPR